MRTALLWVITKRVVTISYRPFLTTYRFYLQRFFPEDGTDRLPRMSVSNYHYSLINNPEERTSLLNWIFPPVVVESSFTFCSKHMDIFIEVRIQTFTVCHSTLLALRTVPWNGELTLWRRNFLLNFSTHCI